MFCDLALVHGKAVLVTDAIFAPTPAWWLRASADDRGVVAAVAQAGSGSCQVVDSLGQRWDAGDVAFGTMCVGIEPLLDGWQVTFMLAPTGSIHRVVHLTRALALAAYLERPGRTGGTSQGFLDVFDGVPVFTDDHRTVVCGHLTIGLPTTRGFWTVGQDWFGDRIVAWNAQTQTAWEVSRISTQTPSHLAIEDDGTAVVAIGGTDVVVRQPAFVPCAPWVEAVTVPDFAPCPHEVGVGVFDESHAPELIGADEPRSSQSRGVFVTLGRDDLQKAAVRCRREALPMYAYRDTPDYPVSAVPVLSGVTVLALVCGYPFGAEAPEETAARVSATVYGLRRAGHAVALCLPCDRGIKGDGTYTWSEQQICDVLGWLWPVTIHEGVTAVWGFAQRRGPHDGLDAFPSLQECVDRMRAASPDWRLFPVAATPPPTVVPPEPPNPKPPIPVPMPGLALEMFMSEGAFTVAKSTLVKNTSADVVDPVFVGDTYHHIKHPGGGFVSIDPVTFEPRSTGAAKVGPSENFQLAKDGKSALVNMGLPLAVRSFVVADTL